MSRSRYVLATLSLLAFTACSDDASGPDTAQYDIEVTGDVTARLRGPASFGADTGESGEPIFGVLLGDLTSEHTIVFAKDGSARPAAGQYSIREPGTGGAGWDAIYIIGDSELDGLLVADSGRITITESRSDRLRGSIRLYASGLVGDGTLELREAVLTGTFDAKPLTQGITAAMHR